jgi:hypothetical protein
MSPAVVYPFSFRCVAHFNCNNSFHQLSVFIKCFHSLQGKTFQNYRIAFYFFWKICFRTYFCRGGMSERFNEAVLKTVDPKGPGVRIPLPPLNSVSNVLQGS